MRNLILFTIMAIGIASCQPEFDELGEPISRVDNLSGTWSLVSVTQIDEKAVSKGYPLFVQQIDLTERAGFNSYELVIGQNDSGELTTFEENNTDSPSIIGFSSGSISLDDPQYPEIVTFTGSSSQSFSLKIDTYLGLSAGELSLSFSRSFDGEPIVSYIYKFEK